MKQQPRATKGETNREAGRSPLGAAKRHAASLVALVVLAAVGTLANRRPPEVPHAPLPAGWVWAPDSGATLTLALQGGVVWAGGKTGLYRLDRKTGALLEHVALGTAGLHVRSLAVDADGALWVGHLDGLIRYADGRTRSYGERDGLPNKRVNALLAVGARLYVGTGAGLVVLENGTFRTPSWAVRLPSKIVNVLFRSSEGCLWVGSSSDPEGGVARVQEGRVDVIRVGQGLPHPYVQAFAEEAPGRVWAATGQFDKGGAVLLPTTGPMVPLRTLHRSDGLAGEKVRSLGRDADGRMWFGSESDGLAILGSEGASLVLTTRDGLPHNEITAIRRDGEGTMWLATLEGVVRVPKEAIPVG